MRLGMPALNLAAPQTAQLCFAQRHRPDQAGVRAGSACRGLPLDFGQGRSLASTPSLQSMRLSLPTVGSLDSALDWGSSMSWQRALDLPISRCCHRAIWCRYSQPVCKEGL